MSKKKAAVKNDALAVVKPGQLSLSDIGKIVLRDADNAVQDQVARTIRNIAEHVISRQRYYMKTIEENQHMLAEFKRKQKAIADGEFTVNKFDGTVKFNDDTLERLG